MHIMPCKRYMLLTKTIAAQNEVALSYHKVRGLYFQAVVFATSGVQIQRALDYTLCRFSLGKRNSI